jgi:hypothetical protein
MLVCVRVCVREREGERHANKVVEHKRQQEKRQVEFYIRVQFTEIFIPFEKLFLFSFFSFLLFSSIVFVFMIKTDFKDDA